jgi:hypothetical protein
MIMKRVLFTILCIVVAGIASAQYINRVFEYKPAPGQFINVSPWGTPAAIDGVTGGVAGNMTLGAFGGYVVFGFEDPVVNDPQNPYGVDFTIFGNAYADWSEPAAVYVMKDENGNGLPDDTWYQLAGSDHFFSSTNSNYEITWVNPGGETALDIPWSDNYGNSGLLEVNEYHSQPWYPSQAFFPEIDPVEYTLSGTFIDTKVDTSTQGIVKSYVRTFGYADNHQRGAGDHVVPDNPYTMEIENSGGDAFDISWAINNRGEYVDIDQIDFVKMQSASMGSAGWLGELSTELCGAADVAPDPDLKGEEKVLVMKDLPLILKSESLQLESAFFIQGRVVPDARFQYTVSSDIAYVDEESVLHIEESGVLTITATLENEPQYSCTRECVVELQTGIEHVSNDLMFNIFPVPATEVLSVKSFKAGAYELLTINGQMLSSGIIQPSVQQIDISNLDSGLYIFSVIYKDGRQVRKFMVQ